MGRDRKKISLFLYPHTHKYVHTTRGTNTLSQDADEDKRNEDKGQFESCHCSRRSFFRGGVGGQNASLCTSGEGLLGWDPELSWKDPRLSRAAGFYRTQPSAFIGWESFLDRLPGREKLERRRTQSISTWAALGRISGDFSVIIIGFGKASTEAILVWAAKIGQKLEGNATTNELMWSEVMLKSSPDRGGF